MKTLSAILILFLVTGIAGTVHANHLLGGEIGYTFVSSSGNNQTYQVRLAFFADCSSNLPGGAFGALIGANPGVRLFKGNTQLSLTRLRYVPAESNIEITPVCPDEAGNTACININNPLPGIKKFVYTGNITVSGVSADWRFAFEGDISTNPGTFAGRSVIVQNADVLGGSSQMYLEATLNNTTGVNSSTLFTSLPTPFFCVNKAQTYSLGAADSDNDNLTFSLVPAQQVTTGTTTPEDITYLFPFSATAPLPVATGTFNFNTTNGQLNFTPNEVKNCVVVNLVEEFRNGVRVGSSMREMIFIILDNCSNDAPTGPVSNIKNANIKSENGNLILEVCEGQESDISFDINSADINGDNINITSANLPEGATLDIVNNGSTTPVLHFKWNANKATPGNYIIYVTYTDDGCPLVSSQTIAYTIRILPFKTSFTHDASPPCVNTSNGKAWALPVNDATVYEYRWLDASGNIIRTVNSGAGDTLSNIPFGTYTLQIRDTGGCGKNLTITLPDPIPLPEIVLPRDTTLCEGMPVDLSVNDQQGVTYLWSTGDTTCCITVDRPGIYKLQAFNICGVQEKSVKVDYVPCSYCLFVPNAFSPNGDGNNDVFKITQTCPLDKYKLKIYNRWGQMVFVSYRVDNSWDGTYQGNAADIGTYYYVIEATIGANNTERHKGDIKLKGDITLIR
ncbi:gliding motility-associated C-terminal domain-containing protein [Taibaiella chishuiensis]|uniref:Gliding motility-associated-like protein n=1 Tax=Taibaiella chishuiensis TaxID=1434707 RepID=A0A2P8D9G3_9BACT|nr:gliding motility-associated C-terminal domain-containing protein [Taibaiella chishuiensis]PSK93865.1 gliding motility-associated-like protein [Taibaiella chishuiensis]